MALGAPNKYTPDVPMALCCNTFHTVRGDAPNGWTFESKRGETSALR